MFNMQKDCCDRSKHKLYFVKPIGAIQVLRNAEMGRCQIPIKKKALQRCTVQRY